jgi:phosphatidylinositol alpha-1,6-mannosyltransferase
MLSSPTATGDVEGFGIAILEANALGVPAIGAMGCGIEDAIANYKSGILVSPYDTSAFLDALQVILNQHEAYSQQAKAWAKSHHWELIIKQYIHAFDL